MTNFGDLNSYMNVIGTGYGGIGTRDLAHQQVLQQRQAEAYAAMLGQQFASPIFIPTGGETMLEKLKNLTATLALKGAVDALVELAAFGRSITAEYEAQKLPVPEWLPKNLKALSREIAARWKADRAAQLAAAEKELEELRSREEKRVAKEAEVKRLREELGE
jgi:hypothetical protein